MSRILSSVRYEQLQDIAADLIEDYGFEYPLQPLRIAEVLGVRVNMVWQWSADLAHVCGTVDGFTVPVDSTHGMTFEIHLNAAMPPVRQRFTAIHELSHIILEHPFRSVWFSEDVCEAEANHLASYLLAPDALVSAWVPTLGVAGVARQFAISQEAARLAQAWVLRAQNRGFSNHVRDRCILAAASRCEVPGGWVEPLELWGSA